MKQAWQSALTGERGTFLVTGTDEVQKRFVGLQVVSVAVIDELKIGETNVLTNYIDDATASIPAGTIVKVQGDKPFTAITLTSGVVNLIIE
jgi:spore coat polysaccharide biosynthesis protein SpsF (cytidylyltransferase family)